MKIQAVTIGGFKNISCTRLSFGNITALVSLNNFGKSNVLTAIDFGLDFLNETISNKRDMMANMDLIPLNKNMFGQNFRFELDLLTTIGTSVSEEYQVIYGFEFCWKTNEDRVKLFESYATIWCGMCTDEVIVSQVANDPHSPSYIRVNAILSTIDSFYETYDVKEGDGMYIAPEKRISRWH